MQHDQPNQPKYNPTNPNSTQAQRNEVWLTTLG